MAKDIYIKVYDTNDALTKVFYDFSISDPSETINGGSSAMSFVFPDKREDLINIVEKNYKVDIYIYDTEEVQIYSGRVDAISTVISDIEQTEVLASGYVAELAQNLLDDGTTVRFVYTQQYIEDILEDILDKHNASLPSAKVNYSASSIGTTSKKISIKFFASTVLEAIQAVINKADAGWFFRVGPDNVFYFDQVSTTPDHYFTMGKDISMLKVDDSDRTKITRYLFYNGRTENEQDFIFKLYSSGSSDRRFQIKRDDRVTKEETADEEASRVIDTFEDGTKQVTTRIIDSNIGGGYDIESINVGDTCKFLNVDSNLGLPDNGIIISKVHNLYYADLVIEDSEKYVSRELLEQKQTLSLANLGEEVPEGYTT